jgi:hypothetical protein
MVKHEGSDHGWPKKGKGVEKGWVGKPVEDRRDRILGGRKETQEGRKMGSESEVLFCDFCVFLG